MNREQLLELLAKVGSKPDKALGQNFLINERIIEAIINEASLYKADSILEIGPGLGSLTEHLPQEKMTLIELDRDFAKYWRDKNYPVNEVDALKWDWSHIKSPQKTILVSNLPYQISSSIVIDRCMDSERLLGMVLMFQKEVAQKIQAPSGDSNFGMLSVVSQTFWKIEKVVDASPNDYYPPPKVYSRVLSFSKQDVVLKNPNQYLKFLKLCFVQPRKKMISNLKSEFQLIALEKTFAELQLQPNIRPHQLTIKQYLALFKSLSDR